MILDHYYLTFNANNNKKERKKQMKKRKTPTIKDVRVKFEEEERKNEKIPIL